MLAEYFPIEKSKLQLAEYVITEVGDNKVTLNTVENLSENNFLLFAGFGVSRARIAKITDITGKEVTLDVNGLKSLYNQGTTAYKCSADTFQVYRKNEAGEFVGIGEEVLKVDPTQKQGIYFEDETGSIEKEYKFELLDSVTTTIAYKSQVFSFDQSIHFTSINKILIKAGKQTARIDRLEMETYRQTAEDEVKGYLIPTYTLAQISSSPFVDNLVSELGAYYLISNKYVLSEAMERRYHHILKTLNHLQVGKISLVNEESLSESVSGARSVSGYPNKSTSEDEGYMFKRTMEF